MSEFEMQGLELDHTGLLWGGDLIFSGAAVRPRKLSGTRWVTTTASGDAQASADDPATRIRNKYRVLLTRFRKSMVIFVPVGSMDDETRRQADFDGIYDFLTGCGVRPLASDEEF